MKPTVIVVNYELLAIKKRVSHFKFRYFEFSSRNIKFNFIL
jgi:hypothetical protein